MSTGVFSTTICFCKLIMYSATLLQDLISYDNWVVGFLVFLVGLCKYS